MLTTIFNPPAYEPVHVLSLAEKQKLHITVVTAANTVRIAKTKGLLELGNNGGQQLTAALGPIEIEWQGDVWAHGVSGNATPTAIDVET